MQIPRPHHDFIKKLGTRIRVVYELGILYMQAL